MRNYVCEKRKKSTKYRVGWSQDVPLTDSTHQSCALRVSQRASNADETKLPLAEISIKIQLGRAVFPKYKQRVVLFHLHHVLAVQTYEPREATRNVVVRKAASERARRAKTPPSPDEIIVTVTVAE